MCRPGSPVRSGGDSISEWTALVPTAERERARELLTAFGLNALYGGGIVPQVDPDKVLAN
jgi:hypothetical protein